MKKAMVDAYENGFFDRMGYPLITVHDELVFSDSGWRQQDFADLKSTMENAIPLSIPVRADVDIGPDWGHVKEMQLA